MVTVADANSAEQRAHGGEQWGVGGRTETTVRAETETRTGTRGGVEQTAGYATREGGSTWSDSSDDSDNSEEEDRRLAEAASGGCAARRRSGRRRRVWMPATTRAAWNETHVDTMAGDARRTESYIGDTGEAEVRHADTRLRVATSNINKGIWGKIDREIRTWFIANRLDFMLISDAGAGSDWTKTIWARATNGSPAPGMLVVTSARAAIVIDQRRWESRWKKTATARSPSARSVCITLRLGKRAELVLVATYLPDTPHEQQAATRQERAWIAEITAAARARGDMVIVAGDFNTYSSEELDRSGPSDRQAAARQESRHFTEWMAQMTLTSTFRQLHALTPRFTYERAGTRSALDDILVSDAHARQVEQSGIWIDSVQASDHVGTPFAVIALDRNQKSRHQLREVQAIKRVPTKTRTQAELTEFTQLLAQQLECGQAQLIPLLPHSTEQMEGDTVRQWLESAVDNLYQCMYGAAKRQWGETSQCRRDIDRAVSIKRTTRCHGQLKQIRRIMDQPVVDVQMAVTAMCRVQWPKWVLFPQRTPAGSPHAAGAQLLHDWIQGGAPHSQQDEDIEQWFNEAWTLWKRVLRTRRDWRVRQRARARELEREGWMQTGKIRSLLQATLGKPLPPVTIQGALVDEGEGQEYVESRAAVQQSMCDLLDSWVPAEQRTSAPSHLSTSSPDDIGALPQFVREWLLPDIAAGGSRRDAFEQPGHTWHEFTYDVQMQRRVDQKVSKGVSPGYGGVAQELWVAAPETVREREREIFNIIIRTGVTPTILNHRQMIFLPKTASASGVWERNGLPPWRPITVQSALTTRLFTAISWYLEDRAPNHPMQHGFQRDRNVQDAALATTLLMDRATRRKEELFILSKDCEKCYDRIPKWVMDYIYRSLGVPDLLRRILMEFLSAGEIDIRTAYGWIPTGAREFGLGQGSVLSIRHIGYYMDKLMERQTKGTDGVVVRHNQEQGGCVITSTVLVDDVIDVATTRAGMDDRVAVSNVFTGIDGTGGVFGAGKSFLLHYTPREPSHAPTVYLNDGLGVPRAVTMVAPSEGFKHLGVVQSTVDVWSVTLKPVWDQIKKDARAIAKAALAPQQLRYIVNHVWMPRVLYRTQLGTTIKAARHIDKLIRRVARQSLRLPHSMPVAWFTDVAQGLGLQSCVDVCHATRVQIALRTLNTPHIPAYHLLTEALEAYQVAAGLTDHPLVRPIAPPSHCQQWVHQTIRAAATIGVKTAVQWVCPPSARSSRPNDRSVWDGLQPSVARALLAFNLRVTNKIRHIGDIACVAGATILVQHELQRRHTWTRQQTQAYADIAGGITRAHCIQDSRRLRIPVGRTVHDARHLQVETLAVGPEQHFVVSEFAITAHGLVQRGYEIGQRIGETIHANPLGLGTEIDVRWWHERTPRSDIWTARTGPGRVSTEYADICVAVQATPLPHNGRTRLIFWTDTNIGGVVGTESRAAIDESFRRSVRRHEAALENGRVADEQRHCIRCYRRRGTTICAVCEQWHHAECRTCPAPVELAFGSQWVTCRAEAAEETATCAGDGSVRAGGTDRAHGGWGLRTNNQRHQGRATIHWKDMTSTRMECHALIMGLTLSGDNGHQVCDNQAAIGILTTARAMANGQRSQHIAYTNRHRVEIRSMVALMRPGGTFTPQWVRSHEEHMVSEDDELNDRRAALAQADDLATGSYAAELTATYTSTLHWDAVHLLDDADMPVLGNTRAALVAMAATTRKNQWIQHQQERGEHRETACATTISTADTLGWSAPQRRFYWRAIGHALHTNAQKHRLHPLWDGRCRCCAANVADTQEHRFGIGNEPCTSAAVLHQRLSEALERTSYEQWMPDQEYYPPGRAAELARTWGLPTRSQWTTPVDDRTAQRTLIQISPRLWANAIFVADIIHSAVYIEYACSIIAVEQRLRRAHLTGRLLPRSFQQAVARCSPQIALCEYHPCQVNSAWQSGTLAAKYPQYSPALVIPNPPTHQAHWWIDDVFIPRSHDDWCNSVHHRAEVAWIACYDGTATHTRATAAGAEWFVHIPKGELRMRTTDTVYQAEHPAQRRMTSRNPRAIWIGVTTRTTDTVASARWGKYWAEALCQEYTRTWLTRTTDRMIAHSRCPRHAVFAWSTHQPGLDADDAAQATRAWLTGRHPHIYQAPSGWRTFPSATPELLAWARDLTHTNKDAKRWMAAVLRVHWDELRVHWNRTCGMNADAITAAGEHELLNEVNQAIHDGRRAWQGSAYGLDTAIAHHTAQLTTRTTAWTAARAVNQERANP